MSELYIHQHVENIGKLLNQNNNFSSVTQDITQTFIKQKQQAVAASKAQFKRLYFSTLKLSNKAKVALADVFNEEDDLLKELDSQLKKGLEQQIASENIERLIEIQRNLSHQQIANLWAKKVGSGASEKTLKEFNQLINALIEVAKIIQNENGGAALLGMLQNFSASIGQQTKISVAGASVSLQKAINRFKKENNSVLIDMPVVNNIIEGINKITTTLHLAASEESYSKRGANQLISGIFSTEFGEAIAGTIRTSVEDMLAEAILKSAGTLKTTGQKAVKIEYTDEYGRILTNNNLPNEAKMGKADIKREGVSLSLISTPQKIELDVGISVKTYKTNKIGKLSSLGGQTISSGSGGTIKEAFLALFGNNFVKNYYGYNIMAHSINPMVAEQSGLLNDLLLTRQITRLFASRGGSKDFAQFILINGTLVSIYDIILLSETMSFNKSASQESTDSKQGIYLSIPDRLEISNLNNTTIENNFRRSKLVQSKIDNTRIYAHIHLDKLLQNFQKKI